MRRGSWKSSPFPRIAGVQWSSTVGSTLWGMAPGVAVVLGIVLGGVVGINASVRRAGERKSRLSFSSRGGLERDGDDSPPRG